MTKVKDVIEVSTVGYDNKIDRSQLRDNTFSRGKKWFRFRIYIYC